MSSASSGRRPTVGVLALQGDVIDHRRRLDSVGADTLAVRRAADLERCDGLVVPGGESTAMSRLLTVFDLVDPIREYVDEERPIYGSCAGMILLARTVLDTRPDAVNFGAIDITVRRNAFGRQVNSFESDLDVVGLEDPFRAVFIRAPWVEEVGPAAEVIATVAGGPHAGRPVAVQQGVALCTSFHPEITDDDRIHGLFIDMVRRAMR